MFADTEEESVCRQQATGLVRAYLEQVQHDEPLLLAVETNLSAPLTDPFTGESLGLPLVGILDLVLDDPAGPLVVDFKTAARGGEVLELAHELHLSAYSLLLRHNALRPESGVEIRSPRKLDGKIHGLARGNRRQSRSQLTCHRGRPVGGHDGVFFKPQRGRLDAIC